MRSRPPAERGRVGRRAVGGLAATVLVAVACWLGPVAPLGAQAPDGGSGSELPVPEPDPDEVRAEADRILAGEEYGTGDDPTSPSGPADADGSGGRPPEMPEVPQPPAFAGLGAVGQAIMWIVVVALAALAVWVLVRAVQAQRRRAEDDDVEEVDDGVSVVDDGGDELDPMLRPADEWRRLAAVAETEGRWREGLRFRYRALLADLISQQVVDDLPGRTTGEYRVEVAVGAPAAAGDFDGASELFDRAWYGARPTGATERDRFVGHEDRVLAHVPDEADR